LLSSVFDCLSKVSDISVRFFGPNPTLPKLNFVENRGSATRKTMMFVQEIATALMCIGRADTCFVSSKIFDYISTGRPIIHFYSRDDDPNLPYLKKYPAALLLDTRNEANENADRVAAFLANPPNIVPFSQLKELYPENDASHTVQVIKAHFETWLVEEKE
jgi:hypothetical protein